MMSYYERLCDLIMIGNSQIVIIRIKLRQYLGLNPIIIVYQLNQVMTKDKSVIQVSIIGPSGVGKTTLAKYINNIKHGGDPTLGTNYYPYTYNNRTIFLWDNPGSFRYREVVFNLSKRYKSFIFMFDLSSFDSFSELRQIIQEFQQLAPLEKKVCVIGNKSDQPREIEKDFIENYWKQKEINYVEINFVCDTEALKKIQSILAIFALQHQCELQKEQNIKLKNKLANSASEKKRCCSN